MSAGQRRRPLISLRLVVLALFAFTLVLQPVLAAAGELHELAHDSSGKHSGIDSDPLVIDRAVADIDVGDQSGTGEDETAVLHVLLQCAHCCGSGAAMVPLFKSVPQVTGTEAVVTAELHILPAARLPGPFKPPIFA